MRRRHLWWFLALVALIFLGAILSGPIMSNVENPKYTVVEKSGNIEVRDYAPMIVAETVVRAERREAIRRGFRIIADYIFGNNSGSERVEMTAPVTQQRSGEKIPMTAPVTQQQQGGRWLVRFVMPSNYTMDSLPKPNNPAVVLREISATRFAAICFSGIGSEASLQRHTKQLMDFIGETKLRALSQPTYAFYNPPWTLPFLRRNEIIVEVGPVTE